MKTGAVSNSSFSQETVEYKTYKINIKLNSVQISMGKALPSKFMLSLLNFDVFACLYISII